MDYDRRGCSPLAVDNGKLMVDLGARSALVFVSVRRRSEIIVLTERRTHSGCRPSSSCLLASALKEGEYPFTLDFSFYSINKCPTARILLVYSYRGRGSQFSTFPISASWIATFV
jgi:hypothetical protein